MWAGFALLLVAWVMNGLAATAQVRRPDPRRDLHRDYALLLKRLAKPTDVIAAQEVGTLAYYSDRRVLDLCGLTCKDMLPLLKRPDPLAAAMDKFQPAFVMTYEIQGTWSRHYEIVRSRPFVWPGSTYRIWRRKDIVAPLPPSR